MQFTLAMLSLGGLSLWSWIEARKERKEYRKERREDYERYTRDRKDDVAKMEAWKDSHTAILVAIKDDMKDFHGRLCALEERYTNWLMREK